MTRGVLRAPRRRRAAVAALATVAALVPVISACSADQHTTAGAPASSDVSTNGARTSACRPVPAAGAELAWLPAELPLPSGSFPIQDVDAAAAPPSVPASDTHRGLIAVHASVTDFTSFIASEWTSRGWTLGKGDAERGEAEAGYRRGDFGGSYRIRDVYCDPTFTELLLVYGPGATTADSTTSESS
jgi:hypothetical protein